MKTTKHARRGLSLLLVAALMLVFCIPSFAVGSDITPDQEHTQGYTYEAPTSPMVVDDNIITATAHRAASPILGMMGVNATSGFGAVSGSSFTDVPAGSYFVDSVAWAVEAGITQGATSTEFDPDTACSRAMAVTFLRRAAGCPAPASSASSFTDVQNTSDFYYSAVLWAVENGITQGATSTEFAPDTACSRAMVVTFLYRDFV